ncbi:MAG TPA: dienelactone hydrolase family protein [Thermoanaerobaculia bacterium]
MAAVRRLLGLASLCLLLAACLNHFVYHPRKDPPAVTSWSQEVVRGKLLLRLEWASPEGDGPFPAVLVHPEAGHTAGEMRGVVRDLARAGYLAVAVDYRREQGGLYRATLFTWRDPDDPRAAFDVLRSHPKADPSRIGALGFSQGGVYSLLIAAYTGQVAAVVAYYPVTDFELWLDDPARRGGRRLAFRLIRRHFRKELGARDDRELSGMLARASAFRQVEAIRAPVLLIHGERDTSAGVGESERLERRLKELGREVELLVIPGAGHVFNFRDRDKAETAWTATRAWLDRYLRPSSKAR